MDKIGLIAGNGRFPILFAKGARDNNVPVIAVGIEGETSPEIEQYVEKLYWVSAPYLSMRTSGLTTLPLDLDIFAPSLIIMPWVKRCRKGSLKLI